MDLSTFSKKSKTAALILMIICLFTNNLYSQKKAKAKQPATEGREEKTTIGSYDKVYNVGLFYFEILEKGDKIPKKDKYETESQYQARIPKPDTSTVYCLNLTRDYFEVEYNPEKSYMNIKVGAYPSDYKGQGVYFTMTAKENKYKAKTVMGVNFEANEVSVNRYGVTFTTDEYLKMKETMTLIYQNDYLEKKYLVFDTIIAPNLAKYYEETLIPYLTGSLVDYNSTYSENTLPLTTPSLSKPKVFDVTFYSVLFKPRSLILYDPKKKEIFREINLVGIK